MSKVSKVTCVFQCTNKQDRSDGGKDVSFIPPYNVDTLKGAANAPGTDGAARYQRVNEEWSKYTPSGRLELAITNAAAHEALETGKVYLVTIEEYDIPAYVAPVAAPVAEAPAEAAAAVDEPSEVP